jgi:ABC-type polysaccharide/polyol phosphate export permease
MIPVYEVLLTIWFYATPIIYPAEAIPEQWSWIYRLNPLYYLITAFREPLFSGTLPEPLTWGIAILAAVIAFLLGGVIFTLKSHEYAYRI